MHLKFCVPYIKRHFTDFEALKLHEYDSSHENLSQVESPDHIWWFELTLFFGPHKLEISYFNGPRLLWLIPLRFSSTNFAWRSFTSLQKWIAANFSRKTHKIATYLTVFQQIRRRLLNRYLPFVIFPKVRPRKSTFSPLFRRDSNFGVYISLKEHDKCFTMSYWTAK